MDPVTAVTTVTDFLGSADITKIGDLPYWLTVLALFLVPVFTQVVKQLAQVPKWVKMALPSVISLIGAVATAFASGFMPWSAEGLNIMIAVMLGGAGGQGVYTVNKKIAKNAHR